MLLKDAAVVQNAVASESVASSPTPIFALASASAPIGVYVAAAGLKAKLYNLGLFLKDNTQSQFLVAVLSPSSLSSKAPIANPTSPADAVCIDEVAFELKATGPLPSVGEKLQVFDSVSLK